MSQNFKLNKLKQINFLLIEQLESQFSKMKKKHHHPLLISCEKEYSKKLEKPLTTFPIRYRGQSHIIVRKSRLISLRTQTFIIIIPHEIYIINVFKCNT